MGSGELCPELIDPAKRADITRNLLSYEELILSLYILIKDIRYLKYPANHLSRLLPASRLRNTSGYWVLIRLSQSAAAGGTYLPTRIFDSKDRV
ncbi:uncharacterized protein RSE6_15038 [Rhynchosporium secalis]|uniref:Uncharacterized protein n=1 Tax=Rhynchosporium secalis TaxID=38038 RepID=A0A1E1MWN0_RHYSE|nr:uncharacterized protein RSE6_15038 [Rhynchosporium secalis]